MHAEDCAPLPPHIEIATARSIGASLLRTTTVDDAGLPIEALSAAPIELLQLKTLLTFIQQQLLRLELGDGDNRFYLDPKELHVEYVQWPTERDGSTELQAGHRLTLVPKTSRVDAKGIEKLQAYARELAWMFRNGPYVDIPVGLPKRKNDPDFVAAKLQDELKGRNIQHPFIFTSGQDEGIEFAGRFAGDEEQNLPPEQVVHDGFINWVTYRGKTLSFELETRPPLGSSFESSKKLKIEFAHIHRDAIHSLASNTESLVRVQSDMRVTKNSRGKTASTYTLVSVNPARSTEDQERTTNGYQATVLPGEQSLTEWSESVRPGSTLSVDFRLESSQSSVFA